MAKTRRVIRKVSSGSSDRFEDQLWPIVVAMFILGGVIAGIILGIFSLDDSRILYNAMTYLALLPLMIGATTILLAHLNPRTVRRGLVLSAILSVVANLVILVMLAVFDLIPMPIVPPDPEKRQLVDENTVFEADYHPTQVNPENRPREDHEKPVETRAPEVEDREVPHEKIEEKEPESERQPTVAPEPEQTVKPNLTRRPDETEAVPRQSDQQSRLSRQMARSQPLPTEKVSTRKVANQAERRLPQIEAQTQPVKRQAVEHQAQRRETDAEPETQIRQETMQIAKREANVEPIPESTTSPVMRRQMETPRMVPRTMAETAEVASQPQQTDVAEMKPNNTEAMRERTQSPTRERQPSEVTHEAFAQVDTKIQRRSNPAERAPTISQAPSPLPARRQHSQTRPDISTVVANARPTTSPTNSSNPSLRPSDSSVSRQQNTERTTSRSMPSLDAASTGSTSRIARSATRAEMDSQVPTVSPESASTASPERSTRIARFAASPAPVASPQAFQSDQPNSRPSSRPAATALSKAITGKAGQGRSANLDTDAPAPERTAQVALGSAKRPKATQTAESGPAITPQDVARVSRARAGGEMPSTTLEAQAIDVATAAGARHVAQVQSSASGSVSRAAANAEQGAITASSGMIEVDLGATQIVSNSGQGRAAGGGQPIINPATRSQRIGRRAAEGGPTVAVAANLIAPTTESPEGDGGGAPPVLQPNVAATEAARHDSGGDIPTSGGPSNAEEAGPEAVASSADAIGAAEIGRAEVVIASAGMPQIGGGTASLARSSSGPVFAANTQAETVAIQGAEVSSGAPQGVSIEAQGTQQARAAAGLHAPATDDAAGAAEAMAVVDAPIMGGVGTVTGVRKASPSEEDGPLVSEVAGEGAPLKRSTITGLPMGEVAQVDVPAPGASDTETAEDVIDFAFGADSDGIAREEAGALEVSVEEIDGPGGLGLEITPNVGTNRRQADPESQEIHSRTARFVSKRSGGMPGINTLAKRGVLAFDKRARRLGDDVGGESGKIAPETEFAIELGLQFLSRHQLSNGCWSLNNLGAAQPDLVEDYVDERAALRSDTAATGLTLMAFLGAGYQHKDFKYKDVVGSGLNFLIQNQKGNGDLFIPHDPQSNSCAWFYSHTIATLALCEAYGMTQDPELREPARKAIDFLCESQNLQRGGWRYSPGVSSDTSVTGWAMMALKAGRLGGLEVPDENWEGIINWLDRAQVSKKEPHLFSYNPMAPNTEEQRHGRQASMTMTSVGLLMRMYTGWRRDNKNLKKGADYLLENLPEMGTNRERKRDTYYWYYATQVMRHMGGDHWKQWNEALHPMLAETQIKQGTFAGSWDPRNPVPDRWGPHAGRIYVTTMNLLSLEVDYRLIPIYEETVR